MSKIAVTTTTFAKEDKKPLELLKKNRFEVVLNVYGRKLEKDEVIKLCKDVCGIIAGTERYNAEVLRKLLLVKVISRCGVGLESIDLAVAERLGIKVYNTPDAPTQAVAELTIGLILNLMRKTNQMTSAIKTGKWEKLMGNLLYGKCVGIVGFGRIGKRVAELLKSFGCSVAYSDPSLDDRLLGFRRLPLAKLLGWADIVSLHASTRNIILGKKELRQMKKGAWLINVSRGEVLDEEALYDALKEQHLSGAALDVFRNEPYRGRLLELDNVILTPHIGSYTKESRIKMEIQAVKNLLKGLKPYKRNIK